MRLLDSPIVANPRDQMFTPRWVIERARIAFGGEIDLDPASCWQANLTVKARRFIQPPDDGLLHDWRGNVWINPPFSEVQTRQFAEKALAESGYCKWIMLTMGIATSGWYRELWNRAASVVPLCEGIGHGRLRFDRPDGEPKHLLCLINLFSNLPQSALDAGFGDIAKAR